MKIFAFLLLVLLNSGITPPTQIQSSQPEEIPTVDFCEMVKHPEQYFDKTIRITASWEMGYEGSYLNNVRCLRSHDDSIGVGFIRHREDERKSILKSLNTIMTGKAGPQPRVTLVGILRNASSDFPFHPYRYGFDIVRFEDIRDDITQRMVSFDGTLRAGLTYRAAVRPDEDFVLSFESPLRPLPHQAIRLEWISLDQFPELAMLPGQKRHIVFRVESDDIQQMSEQRWNRTVRLKVLLVE